MLPLLLLATPAAAATFTVNTTVDNQPTDNECTGAPSDCSLRQAIDQANNAASASTIAFSLPAGSTISLTNGALVVSNAQPATITGPGANQLTVNNVGAAPNGGVFSFHGTGSAGLSGVTVSGGSVNGVQTFSGAGIDYTGTGGLALDGVLVSSNTADVSGAGGINDGGQGAVTIRNSTISGNSVTNSSGGNVGGLFTPNCCSSSVLLINTTVANNTVTGGATGPSDTGGIVNKTSLVAVNVTIAGNSTDRGVGGIQDQGESSTQLANTVVATNRGSTAADCRGSFTSRGYNLIGDGDGTGCSFRRRTGDMVGTTASPIDPRLGALGNNGGPTPTMALLAGSPAIDAGNPATASDLPPGGVALVPCRTTDQRGLGRPDVAGTACDIGAFEFYTAPVVVTGQPSSVSQTGATLNATVNPNSAQVTDCHFDWGTSSAYGNSVPCSPSPGSGSSPVPVSATLSGLAPGSTYHVRAVATNAGGTSFGADQTFTTQAASCVSEPHGPTVTITSDQGDTVYVPGDVASISVVASGNHLTQDPSGAHEPISTATSGTFTLQRTATDACGTTTATFTYTVIPRPVFGKTVDVEILSGFVLDRVPPDNKVNYITEVSQVPEGTHLDTRGGLVRLTIAINNVGTLQSGDFGGGIFTLQQPIADHGLQNLVLGHSNPPAVCLTPAQRAGAHLTSAQAARLSRQVLGLLHANAHGKFSTRGQWSAATVRGTVWDIENRCDGTLVHVVEGAVFVHDYRRHKTLALFTGQSYLAPAPGG